MGRRKKRLPTESFPAHIESLSHEGRGISHINDKVTFVRGALANEDVSFQYTNKRAKFDEGQVTEIINASENRVTPKCLHFGVCGGCSLQHLKPEQQIQHKQNVLLEQLEHIGKTLPAEIMPPITGQIWGYRNKARLGVKYVEKKSKVLVGFREYQNRFIADITQCEVLHPDVGHHLSDLQKLIYTLDARHQIPQIEVAIGEGSIILIFRHLIDLSDADIDKLKNFESNSKYTLYLQAGGPDTIKPLSSQKSSLLNYQHPDHNITIEFKANDFTQVNTAINQAMVNKACELLDLNQEDIILDLFCGLGNFTLPVAQQVKHVTGVEIDTELVTRAQQNAELNQIKNTNFVTMDLATTDLNLQSLNLPYNKLLLDPARSGADIVLEKMNLKNINRIVYVSCNPATLARDTEILVHQKGYKLNKAGVMDMFPHTTHVESIALFIK